MLDPKLESFMTITVIIGLVIYFIPSIIAFCRKVKSKWTIFILNFFFFFSFLLDFLNIGDTVMYITLISSQIFLPVGIVWACVAKKEEQK